MKKVDNATGLTIEVPDDEPRGAFPYFGFWQEAYPQIVSHIQKRKKIKAARGDIDAALRNLTQLVNGPYRVIIADRLYKIGETLRLNPGISAHGTGGPRIRYIKESGDGGRMDIAAIAFEYPIDILIQTALSQGSVTMELSKLQSDIQTTSLELQRYNEEFFALQANIPSQNLLKKMENNLSLIENKILKLEGEYVHAQNIQEKANATSRRMNELASLQRQLKAEVISTQNKMQSKLQLLHKLENKQDPNAINQYTGNIISARRDVQRLGRKNSDVQQRLQTVSIELSRLVSSRDFENEMREFELAARTRLHALNQCRSEQAGLQNEFNALLNEREQTLLQLNDIQSKMRGLSHQLSVAHSQYDKAQSAIGQISGTREDEIIRNWSNHLIEMQREVEQRLFANLAKAAAAQSGSPLAREVEGIVLDASTIKDYEDYLTALDDISDALEDDEYELLEMIGRLGAAQQYVPGATRLYALIQPDMSRRKRMEAYRNMITEILTAGAAATTSYDRGSLTINIPGFGPISLGREKPLAEMIALLRHLSDAGLQFDYDSSRGGN